MPTAEVQEESTAGIDAELIRKQLDLLVHDSTFRSSKRSIQFLRYVVDKTLEGSSEQIKERTIGVEVFGRDPSYDTNVDHIVRTAAIELRKRLAIYYGQEHHRSELRMNLVPGSYVPHFAWPASEHEETPPAVAAEPVEPVHEQPAAIPPAKDIWHSWPLYAGIVGVVICILAMTAYVHSRQNRAQELFWKPVLDTPGSVLLAVGDAPDGPPTISGSTEDNGTDLPIVHKASSHTVPFADTVTIARVLGTLELHGKNVMIRQESESSFSELRASPVVLVGAFNNEWSLRLTRKLRYSLALDPAGHMIYIRDAKNPSARTWNWATNQPTDHQGAAGHPPLHDFALISRIWNSDTGRVVVIIGGLYTYGTEAAGEFLTDPELMQALTKVADLRDPHKNVQIVLGTEVTDGTAGPPRVLAVNPE